MKWWPSYPDLSHLPADERRQIKESCRRRVAADPPRFAQWAGPVVMTCAIGAGSLLRNVLHLGRWAELLLSATAAGLAAGLAFRVIERWTWLPYLRDEIGRRGLCRSCGYDLRATPDQCPECGAARVSA